MPTVGDWLKARGEFTRFLLLGAFLGVLAAGQSFIITGEPILIPMLVGFGVAVFAVLGLVVKLQSGRARD